MPTRKYFSSPWRSLLFFLLLLATLIWLLPFVSALLTSMRTNDDIISRGFLAMPKEISLESYRVAWTRGGLDHYLPNSFIITGQGNDAARYFCKRENFHSMVQGALYKKDVFLQLCDDFEFRPEEAVFFFDDVLGLNVCRLVGLRAQILHGYSPLFDAFVVSHDLADMI